MQTFECVAKRRQRKGLCEARGDDVGEINVKHGPVNAFSQPSLGDMFAGRIDGGERRGKLGRVRNRIFDFWVQHLKAAAKLNGLLLHLAGQSQ